MWYLKQMRQSKWKSGLSWETEKNKKGRVKQEVLLIQKSIEKENIFFILFIMPSSNFYTVSN